MAGAKRSKKHAKGRLDRYYQMAKEQGYRARSAFKLIQLNRKYNLLGKAKCLVDLCAAPGGWLQVASKYMPKPSVIVGVDIVPIKPIPGVITLCEDITTAKCRQQLKGELKQWKADVVLHDGAPNVGTSWLQDAYTQNELVLSSLKLATEFMMPHGTFITKVFRSKDYNKLLWVFHQLFKQVDATKPASSRNVSAEIFVVCRDYLAPKKVDPKLLDARFVFQEGEIGEDGEHEEDAKKKKEKQGALLNDLLHPEKKKRHREGYADGDYTLHHVEKVSTFIHDRDYVAVLSRAHTLDFEADDDGRALVSHPLTTDDIRASCRDLRVLGKKDFKDLLKWRQHIRISLNLDKKKEVKPAAAEDDESGLPMDEDALAEQLGKQATAMEKKARRERRKEFDRKTKQAKRMQLGMSEPMDIGIEASQDGGLGNDVLFSANAMSNGDEEHTEQDEILKRRRIILKNMAADISDDDDEDDQVSSHSDSEDGYDSDVERISRLRSLENEIESRTEHYDALEIERNPAAKVKKDSQKKRSEVGSQFEEWYGVEYDAEKAAAERADMGIGSGSEESTDDEYSDEDDTMEGDDDSDMDGEPADDEGLDANATSDSTSNIPKPTIPSIPVKPVKLSKRAQLFFDNPLFKDVHADEDEDVDDNEKENAVGAFDSEMTWPASSDDEAEASSGKNMKRKRNQESKKSDTKKKSSKKQKKGDVKENKDGFEIVPAVEIKTDDIDDGEYAINTAVAYTIAQKMLRPSGKRDLIDDGYNRYAFNDRLGLPDWFINDEERHNKPITPPTKESVAIMKARMRALDARPIKKVAEAKFRKTLRAARRIQKAQAKSHAIELDPDMPEKSKLQSISDLMAKAKKAAKTGGAGLTKAGKKKDLPKLVVAKGSNRGVQGRPKGVKGRYKMVDSRMKKELRAGKRAQKAKGGKRRK
ncbi:hypothetical protein SmJEL517_g05935 [Synchytrium microbalum]|uniref:Uncharacterized protein n=1 Tax=Synchytrium microbalum TaxID=1806994 RepID=A0A507BXR9_9FUNG|nr:uncharacterized protein SmJEL517_g05935 [Synchytrium microbalum]TPX30516.1 hypothetical protein SmJEL517_g05935 [Synchytrium microbalum]